MSKLILAVLVGSILTITGIVAVTSSRSGQETLKPNSLRWFAEKAKAEGKHKTSIRAPFGDYAGAEDPPDTILFHATIVIAQPIDSYTYAPNDENIVTWYKFKLIETLKEGSPCPRCPDRTLPNEVLPVNEDEFLLARSNGTLTIDDVEVTMFQPGFPPFSKNEKYLLFLMKSPNGTVRLLVGSGGAYTVSPEGAIEPINEQPHPLKDAIKQRFDGSVERLKQHVRKAKKN